jgi:hypothetical protein
MSEVENNNVTKKAKRRGISNETVSTSRLRFSHTDAKPNGLFVAHLDDVQLTEVDMKDDSAMVSFRGTKISRLVITFASNEDDVNKRKYVYLNFMPVESNVNTIPGGKEDWKVNRIFAYLKHILDVYVLHGQEMSAEMEDALTLDYDDTDEQGEYINVPVDVVANAWSKLFANFVNIMNTAKDGKPAYKTADNKFIPVWIKLIRYTKASKGWTPVANGQLSFPTYVGEGVIEIFQSKALPVIKVDPVREAIKPMNVEPTKKAPNVAMPGFGGGINVGAMGSEMNGDFAGSAFGGTGIAFDDDMPEDIM